MEKDIAERKSRELAKVPGALMTVKGVEIKTQNAVMMQLNDQKEPPAFASWMVPQAYGPALDRALDYAPLFENKRMGAHTPTPPVQAFYSECRQPFAAISVVTLWPFYAGLFREGHTAPPGSPVRWYSTQIWRSFVGPSHWKTTRPIEFKGVDFDTESEFLRFGSEKLFLTVVSAKLVTEYLKPTLQRELPFRIGRLACPCPLTVEAVENNAELLCELAFALNLLRLIWFLAMLAQKSLEAAGVRPAKHDTSKYNNKDVYLPDLTAEAPEGGEPRVVQLIRLLVLGGGHIPAHGWPSLWSGVENEDLCVRGRWVQDLREFVCMFADDSCVFETGGSLGSSMPNWSEHPLSRNIDVSSHLKVPFDVEEVAALEQEMIGRLHVLAFKAGILPVEFLKAPDRRHAFKCDKHRGT